jgi:hypothetical protein
MLSGRLVSRSEAEKYRAKPHTGRNACATSAGCVAQAFLPVLFLDKFTASHRQSNHQSRREAWNDWELTRRKPTTGLSIGLVPVRALTDRVERWSQSHDCCQPFSTRLSLCRRKSTRIRGIHNVISTCSSRLACL